MDSSHGALSTLQRELLEAFFALAPPGFFLTGGSALAGFYLGHRHSEDLDLFAPPPADLDVGQRALDEAARSLKATVEVQVRYPDFRRSIVRRNEESTLVDLVLDRAPQVQVEKPRFGNIAVDSAREITANKLCALVGRCEVRDLVDLRALLEFGIELRQALEDAASKDAGVNAAVLAWLLSEVSIGADAPLPGGGSARELETWRNELVDTLRRLAHPG